MGGGADGVMDIVSSDSFTMQACIEGANCSGNEDSRGHRERKEEEDSERLR